MAVTDEAWHNFPREFRKLLWPDWLWMQLSPTLRRIAVGCGSGEELEGAHTVIRYAVRADHPARAGHFACAPIASEAVPGDGGARVANLIAGAEVEVCGESVKVLHVEEESGPEGISESPVRRLRVQIGPPSGGSW